MLDNLKNRLKEIEHAVEQSATHHHALLGRLAEVKFLIEEAEKVDAVEVNDNTQGDESCD